MKRKFLLLTLVVGLSLPTTIPQQGASGAPSARAEVVKLQDILEKGLRAYRPSDFSYIATVVTAVNTGKLTRMFVLGTFHYIRRRYRFKRYLVPHFQRALTKRAAKIGVSI